MGEKEKLLSKFNIKDYKNNLELILESKQFDEEAKSLLLSIFYKLDNFYKDYAIVKKESEQKNKFLEDYISIIKDMCNNIKILPPQKFSKNKKYIINKEKGEIKSFPNENVLLYAVYELSEGRKINTLDFTNINNKTNEINNVSYISEEKKSKENNFLNKCINYLLNKGRTINCTEPIRDFNGWSWNIEINNTKNIEFNLIFQNLLILFGYNFTNNIINDSNIIEKLKEKVIFEKFEECGFNFINSILELAIINYNNISIENHNECLKNKRIITKQLHMLKNKKEYIEKKSNSNSKLIKKIHKIDIMLNDINLIRKEFNKVIKTNPNEYFSLSDFVEDMKNKRDNYLNEIDNNNKLITPKEYLKNEESLCNIKELYNSIKQEPNKISVQSKIIKIQKQFLECLKIKIENANNKKELYNLATQLRYYAIIPYKNGKNITSHEKIKGIFEDISKQLIYKMVEFKLIDIGFRTKKLNYEILKYIFKTKIIKLDNLVIKINFIENNQIQIYYYDGNMLEHKEIFDIPFDEEIINRKDRKIKVFGSH